MNSQAWGLAPILGTVIVTRKDKMAKIFQYLIYQQNSFAVFLKAGNKQWTID